MKIFHLSIIIIIVALISSCASQSPLTGGERDNTPPKLVSSFPQTGSVNINPQQIDFDFDEFIQVKSLNQKLIVSPPLKYQPELKQRAKGFSLIIKDTLKPNSTYNFYFGDAIQDLNENNPLSDFSYVFSTGNEIDTLIASGVVIDASSLKPEKDFLVALYKDTTDSTPLKNKPNYICKTNVNGNFNFKFLKAGKYKIVGFSDKNNNYLLNPENEKIAFQNNLIALEKNKDSIQLFSFAEERTKQFIKKTERKLPYKAEVIFNTNSSIKPYIQPDSLKIVDYFTTPNNDTLIVFFKDSTQFLNEILKLKVSFYKTDSLKRNKLVTDTVDLKWTGKENYISTAKVNLQWSIKNQSKINSKQAISILFNEPIFLESKAIRLADSANNYLPTTVIKDSLNGLKWNIKTTLADGKSYRILFDATFAKTLYNHTLNNDTLLFETMQPEDFANLKLTIKLPYSDHFIIQLIDEKSNIIKTWQTTSDIQLNAEQLNSGKYSLKAIADSNKNGKWDSGFYILHLLPEKVYYYNQTFQLRANWDLEINWSIK